MVDEFSHELLSVSVVEQRHHGQRDHQTEYHLALDEERPAYAEGDKEASGFGLTPVPMQSNERLVQPSKEEMIRWVSPQIT